MQPIYFDIASISSTHYTAFASIISSFEHANQLLQPNPKPQDAS
jgi:hypothetical protein